MHEHSNSALSASISSGRMSSMVIALSPPFKTMVSLFARFLVPEIRKFYEREEGQREFAEWQAGQQLKNKRTVNRQDERSGKYLTARLLLPLGWEGGIAMRILVSNLSVWTMNY